MWQQDVQKAITQFNLWKNGVIFLYKSYWGFLWRTKKEVRQSNEGGKSFEMKSWIWKARGRMSGGWANWRGEKKRGGMEGEEEEGNTKSHGCLGALCKIDGGDERPHTHTQSTWDLYLCFSLSNLYRQQCTVKKARTEFFLKIRFFFTCFVFACIKHAYGKWQKHMTPAIVHTGHVLFWKR